MGKRIVRCNFLVTDQIKAHVFNKEFPLDFDPFDKKHPETNEQIEICVEKAIQKALKDVEKQLKKKSSE